MIKLGKKEKMLAVAFGIFCGIFLLDKVTFSPFLQKLKSLNSQIISSEKKFQKMLQVDLQKESIISTFEGIKPYIKMGSTEEESLSVLMKKVEEMANECNVTILNMKPEMEGEKAAKGYLTRKMELNIESSQRNIIKFLYQMENSSYPLTITKLDFKIKDRTAGSMVADLNVNFLSFL